MKLLLDENLSRRLVPFLLHDYPGTSHVALLGLEQATDMAIWERAKAAGYVLVTPMPTFTKSALYMVSNPSKAVALKLLRTGERP